MSAAIHLDDQREADDQALRAKRLARQFGWCPKCGIASEGGSHCQSCVEVLGIEEVMRRQMDRNVGHACVGCDGAGFSVGFFEPSPCAKCGCSGDSRVKVPAILAVVNRAAGYAAKLAADQEFRCLLVHHRLMEKLAFVVGEPDDSCEDWGDDDE